MTTPADDSPTTYGMRDGFDYDRFTFSEVCPPPTDYVVIFRMAHYRGPDGHLWFSPDPEPGGMGWGAPQNVAEYNRRTGDNASPGEVAAMRDLCAVVDAARAGSARYVVAGRAAVAAARVAR